MFYGLECSFQALFWAVLVLFGVMSLFAVFFTAALMDAFEANDDLYMYYGTLGRSTYSLVKAVTGGQSWAEISDPLFNFNAFYGVLFVLYVLFTLWALMNVITGIFVEHVARMAQRDAESVVRDELHARREHMQNMKHLFMSADGDNSGGLTLEEFKRHVGNARIRAYFRTLGLDITEAESLYYLLDFDGDGEIEADEFIMGLTQLKGPAKSLDMAHLRHDIKKVLRTVNELQHLW